MKMTNHVVSPRSLGAKLGLTFCVAIFALAGLISCTTSRGENPWVKEANAAIEAKQWGQAEATLQKLLNEDAKDVYALANMGAIRHNQVNYDEAETYYRRALAVPREKDDALLTKGVRDGYRVSEHNLRLLEERKARLAAPAPVVQAVAAPVPSAAAPVAASLVQANSAPVVAAVPAPAAVSVTPSAVPAAGVQPTEAIRSAGAVAVKPAGVIEKREQVKVFFNFDSFALTEEGKTALTQFARAQKQKNQMNPLLIEAYTDPIGQADYNQRLSLRRAATVALFLTQNMGLPVQGIEHKGLGVAQKAEKGDTVASMRRAHVYEVASR